MLYLGYVLLRYVLIYNLEVSFNFHLTFLQLNVIKMFIVQQKLSFTLLSAIFFELPITRTFFRFPLKVRVIGSRLYFTLTTSLRNSSLQTNVTLLFICFQNKCVLCWLLIDVVAIQFFFISSQQRLF